MKVVFLLMCFFGVGFLDAMWMPVEEEDLVLNATDILVADYVSMKEEGEVQRAVFKVVEVWKGKLDVKEVVKVRGAKRFVCVPVVNFMKWKGGRYLLILKKGDELYDPFNGRFSVVRITEGKVPWFVEGEGAVMRKPRGLAKVKEKVAVILKKVR